MYGTYSYVHLNIIIKVIVKKNLSIAHTKVSKFHTSDKSLRRMYIYFGTNEIFVLAARGTRFK